MEKNREKKNMPLVILRAILAAYILTGLMLLLLAFLLFQFELDAAKTAIGIIIIYILASFTGGFISGKGSESRKFLWGLLTGAAYFLILLAISVLAGKDMALSKQTLTTFLMCLGGGMLGGMLA